MDVRRRFGEWISMDLLTATLLFTGVLGIGLAVDRARGKPTPATVRRMWLAIALMVPLALLFVALGARAETLIWRAAAPVIAGAIVTGAIATAGAFSRPKA